MNVFTKTSKFAAVCAVVAGLSACTTTDHKSVEDWQGKVWRAVVVKQFVNTTSSRINKEWAVATKFDYSRDMAPRMARVHLMSGFNSTIANVIVPDNIEFSKLQRGTLVDVVTETGPNMDFSMQRFTRILGVVCDSKDDACLDREKAAKRVGVVIDEHPASDISAKHGATYNRRLTADEIKKYD
ncbi:hypothetical protein MasN3_36730 [Massilia varians]|uniref:Lipoprotein n=1 Tax=Massilia varians TaxID=457921 RepID=A0ABN6TGM2_9BURK|nr:hypothetical protein [Massilia varians]BDT60179.1 hypothetical protein MasN3_36730 [Massilia varians]